MISSIVAVPGLASNPKTAWGPRGNKRVWFDWMQDLLRALVSTLWAPRNQSQSDDKRAPIHNGNWLCDYLLKDLPNARIICFNHDTSYQAYALSKSLHDYGKDLLRQLGTVRSEEEVRQDSSGSS